MYFLVIVFPSIGSSDLIRADQILADLIRIYQIIKIYQTTSKLMVRSAEIFWDLISMDHIKHMNQTSWPGSVLYQVSALGPTSLDFFIRCLAACALFTRPFGANVSRPQTSWGFRRFLTRNIWSFRNEWKGFKVSKLIICWSDILYELPKRHASCWLFMTLGLLLVLLGFIGTSL